MGRYSEEAIEDLLQHLDAIDVLELIDYHPEMIQRQGDEIRAFCPLCQDSSERHLTVNARTREFISAPDSMPGQRGNLIELFSRCRRIDFDEAMERLAGEFGLLILEKEDSHSTYDLVAQAEMLLKQAEASEPPARLTVIEEAEKRFRRALESESNGVRAHRGYFRIQILKANPVALAGTISRLLDLEMGEGNHQMVVDQARAYLKLVPNDQLVILKLADALVELGQKSEAVSELMNLAEHAEQAAKPEIALTAYRKVETIDNQSLDVHPLILNILMSQNRRSDSARELARRYQVLHERKDLRGAIEVVRQRIALKPDEDGPMQLIELIAELGLPEEHYNYALELVDGLMNTAKYGPAAECLSMLLNERPEDATIVTMLSQAYESMGEKELVLEMQLRLADLGRGVGNFSEALLILEAIIASEPENTRALQALSEILLQEGEIERAQAILQQLFALYQRANLQFQAIAVVQQMAALDPKNIRLRCLELELQLTHGSTADALQDVPALAKELRAAGDAPAILKILTLVLASSTEATTALAGIAAAARGTNIEQKAIPQLLDHARALARGEKPALAVSFTASLKEVFGPIPALLQIEADLAASGTDPIAMRATMLSLAAEHQRTANNAGEMEVLERLLVRFPDDQETLTRLLSVGRRNQDPKRIMQATAGLIKLARAATKWKEILTIASDNLAILPNQTDLLKAALEAAEKLGDEATAADYQMRLAAAYGALGDTRGEYEELNRAGARFPRDLTVLEKLLPLQARFGSASEIEQSMARLPVASTPAAIDQQTRFLKSIIPDAAHPAPFQRRLAAIYKKAGRLDEMVAEMQSVLDALQAASDTGQAIHLYDELLRDVPESLSTRAAYIELLKSVGQYGDALEQYLIVARQLHKSGKLREAALAYEDMLALDPQNEDTFRGHAAVLRDLKQPAEANQKLRQLAEIFVEARKPEKATAVLREVLENDPNAVEVRRSLVSIRRENGKLQEAVEELGRIADLLLKANDAEGAIKTRREAIAILPDSQELRLALVAQLRGMQRAEEANAELTALAKHHLEKLRYDQSLTILDELIQVTPHSVQARRLRAKVFDAKGDEKRALQEYRQIQDEMDKTPVMLMTMPATAVAEAGGLATLDLQPENDFASFIVGTKNNFAFATAKAVAEHPGSARNPLFLYSDVGLGKTHLLHAIGNHLKTHRPDANILYTSTEYFTSELIDAIRNNTVSQFRNRCRQTDVMLLDDVQFLAGKERSQEEFFYIFNMLYQAKRQIVVTSDRPPKEIAHLDMRLRSRFGQGVIVDIQPPDLETRIAILRAENKKANAKVPEKVLHLIAEQIVSNVRDLKGALNQVTNLQEMGGADITEQSVSNIIARFYRS